MRTFLALAALTGLLAMPSAGYARARPFIDLVEPAEAPLGFAEMCAEVPDACLPPATTMPAARSPDDRRVLRYVNRRVNAGVRQRSDIANFRRADLWRATGLRAGASGDCEDLALEKRSELIGRGYPADRLFLAVVYRRGGVGLHVVLVARTADGDLVLDSRSASIDLWSDTRYAWVSVQSAQSPTAWFRPQPLHAVADQSWK